jgi:hypothetical protein
MFKDTSVGGLVAGFFLLLLFVVLVTNAPGTSMIIGTIGTNALGLTKAVVNPTGK